MRDWEENEYFGEKWKLKFGGKMEKNSSREIVTNLFEICVYLRYVFICSKIQSKQGNIKHPFAKHPIFQLRALILILNWKCLILIWLSSIFDR